MKKTFAGGILKGAAAVWFLFILCFDINGQENTWTMVKNMDEITGHWEAEMPFPFKIEEGMPEFSMDMTLILEYTKSAEKVELIGKIGFGKFLDDLLSLLNPSESANAGAIKRQLWNSITDNFDGSGGLKKAGYEYNDDFQLIIHDFILINDFTADAGVLINQDKTALKFVDSGPISNYFQNEDTGKIEFILYKK
jgi:hypothetical protein